MYKIKKFGFTLAEVLITLVIIGVIAAITVPSILQTTQKQEFVTGLKRANSVLRQSMKLIEINNGYAPGDYSFLKNDKKFSDEFAKVANIIKRCENGRDCLGDDHLLKYYYLNGNSAGDAFTSAEWLVSQDGMTYFYANNWSNFGISNEDFDNYIANISVDVNGDKKPNKAGMDIFLFYVIDGKGIVPAGNYQTNDCSRNGLGGSCAAKVLKEGKISY